MITTFRLYEVVIGHQRMQMTEISGLKLALCRFPVTINNDSGNYQHYRPELHFEKQLNKPPEGRIKELDMMCTS